MKKGSGGDCVHGETRQKRELGTWDRKKTGKMVCAIRMGACKKGRKHRASLVTLKRGTSHGYPWDDERKKNTRKDEEERVPTRESSQIGGW